MRQDTPKSDTGSRERLLQAAIDVFGRYGYEGATTRMIAQRADTNIAAIPYYFEGKEGLYHAVIKHIVAMVDAQVVEVVREIHGTTASETFSREQALALLERLLDKIIVFMVGSPQAPRIARIILREQMYPSSAYELIFKGFMQSILDSLATLITAVSENSSRRTAMLRAMAIMGQIMAFRVARETIVRALDMEGYSQDEMEEIRHVIQEHTRNTLKALS